MSQNQEQIEARLAAYIDGELDAAEARGDREASGGQPGASELIAELMAQRDCSARSRMKSAAGNRRDHSRTARTLGASGQCRGGRRGRGASPQQVAASLGDRRDHLADRRAGSAGVQGFAEQQTAGGVRGRNKETGPVPATLATEEPPGGNPRDAVADKSLETRKDGESLTLSPTTQPAATPAPTVVAAARPGDIIDEKPLAETTATPSPTTMPAHANKRSR